MEEEELIKAVRSRSSLYRDELPTISTQYRSEGRRQGSCAVLGGCLTLSADLAKSKFVKVYTKEI